MFRGQHRRSCFQIYLARRRLQLNTVPHLGNPVLFLSLAERGRNHHLKDAANDPGLNGLLAATAAHYLCLHAGEATCLV